MASDGTDGSRYDLVDPPWGRESLCEAVERAVRRGDLAAAIAYARDLERLHGPGQRPVHEPVS